MDEEHKFFQQTGHPAEKLRKIRKVKYFEERPTITNFFNLNIEEIFFSKSIDWEYEDEWRIIRPLKEADSVVDINNQKIYLFKIPPESIEAIFFGVRTSDEVIKKVITIFNENESLTSRRFMKTILSEDKYEFRHRIVH